MTELRYSRLEHSQAQGSIQQLLRQLFAQRDIISRQQHAPGSQEQQQHQQQQQQAAGGSLAGAGTRGSNGNLAAAAASGDGGTVSGSGSPLSKARSKGKLIGELQQLRAAMAAAECKLGALEAEKVCLPARVLCLAPLGRVCALVPR
jgi:hypothetical protein